MKKHQKFYFFVTPLVLGATFSQTAIALHPDWDCKLQQKIRDDEFNYIVNTPGYLQQVCYGQSPSANRAFTRDWPEENAYNFQVFVGCEDGIHEFVHTRCLLEASPPSNPTPSAPPEIATCKAGSIVNIDEMSVGEQVSVTGTPFELVYSSERVPGNINNNRLHIPLRLNPDQEYAKFSIKYVDRFFEQLTKADYYDFIWDNKDASGNELFGPISVVVGVETYIIRSALSPPEFGMGFNTFTQLGSFDARRYGLGGWSLSVLHHLLIPGFGGFYGKPLEKLFLGDGSIRSVSPQPIKNSTQGEAWQVVDKDAGVIHTFDAQGRHLYTRSMQTNAVLYQFTYTTGENLNAIIDNFGNTTSILRDAKGKPTGIQSPYGQVTRFSTDTNGWLNQITDPAGNAHTATYVDAKGLMKSFSKPGGQVASFMYDSVGRLIQDSNSAGNALTISQLTPESNPNRTMQSVTAEGRTSTVNSMVNEFHSYDHHTGRIIPSYNSTVIDESGAETSVNFQPGSAYSSHDQNGVFDLAYSEDMRFRGQDLDYLYGAANVSSILLKKPNGLTNTASFNYKVENTSATPTPFNYTSLTTESTVNGKLFKSVYNRATGETINTSPMGRVNKLITDDVGTVKQATYGPMAPIQYSYDAHGRLTQAQQGTRSTKYEYDANGWLSAVIDPLNRKSSYLHDPAGKITSMTLPDTRTVSFNYDANGNVTEIVPPSRPTHRFSHNGFDLIDTYAAPGITGVVANNNTQYRYNNDRQITQIDRPNGQAIYFHYTPKSNQLASIETMQGVYQYSFNGQQLTRTTMPNGVFSDFIWSGSQLDNEALGDATGAVLGQTHIAYTNDFRPGQITITTSSEPPQSVAFNYNDDGFLINAGGLALTRATSSGLLTGTSLDSVNDVYQYIVNYGELTAHSTTAIGKSIFSETLRRDNAGRIIKKNETVQDATRIYDYGYDAAGRLTSVKINGILSSNYVYDANSNRTGGIQRGNVISATVDDQDRLVGYRGKTYTYNANGERTSVTDKGATTAYSYDSFGNLIEAALSNGTKINYEVDGLNRRAAKRVNGVLEKRYLYQSELQIAAELSPTGTLLARYVYGSKDHVPDYMVKEGVTYKFVTDYLGSVRMVVNSTTGAIAQVLEYDEYGQVIKDTNPGFQAFGYAGGLYDPVTKLVHFGAREYDAETGRWLSKDPILFAGGDTNLYGYVLQDPVNLIDPQGLRSNRAPPLRFWDLPKDIHSPGELGPANWAWKDERDFNKALNDARYREAFFKKFRYDPRFPPPFDPEHSTYGKVKCDAECQKEQSDRRRNFAPPLGVVCGGVRG